MIRKDVPIRLVTGPNRHPHYPQFHCVFILYAAVQYQKMSSAYTNDAHLITSHSMVDTRYPATLFYRIFRYLKITVRISIVPSHKKIISLEN